MSEPLGETTGSNRNAQLTAEERAVYEWQMWMPGFGEAGQQKLKQASVLVSRVGGLGGPVAYELAAAGIGRLILAHAGNVKPSDLNRQLLMTHASLGKSRVESAARRLQELNPRLDVVLIPENVTPENAERIVGLADIVVDATPMFQERFALNDAVVKQQKPMVDCAMYGTEASITTFIPGRTPCLRCLIPEVPPAWKREFPVFGAISGTVGCMGAFEAIKLLSGIGEPLLGSMLRMDLGDMSWRRFALKRRKNCRACGHL